MFCSGELVGPVASTVTVFSREPSALGLGPFGLAGFDRLHNRLDAVFLHHLISFSGFLALFFFRQFCGRDHGAVRSVRIRQVRFGVESPKLVKRLGIVPFRCNSKELLDHNF